jgi:hypothetical protein
VREVFGFELTVLESVSSRKIFQFQDMLNENRFLGTFRGHSKRPIPIFELLLLPHGEKLKKQYISSK